MRNANINYKEMPQKDFFDTVQEKSKENNPIGSVNNAFLTELYFRYMKAEEKNIAKPVIEKDWNPDICPSCRTELSTDLDDGMYSHPSFLKRCPECNQKSIWKE